MSQNFAFPWRAAACCVALVVAGCITPATAETPLILSHATANEAADFDVYFPLRNKAELDKLVEAQTDRRSAQYHQWLKPADFEARFGPTDDTIARVSAEMNSFGFQVTEHRGIRLHVTASVTAVEAAFGVHINHARFAEGSEALVADGALRLTPELVAAGAHIPQFSTVGPFHKHSQPAKVPTGLGPENIRPENYQSAYGPYLAADLRQAYGYPSYGAVNASGVTIGILMSGGYNLPDIEEYLESWDGIPVADLGTLNTVLINGGAAYSSSNSGETHLDIEQSMGMAIGASEILYNLSDLSNTVVLFGLNTIVSDNNVAIVNMSFGEPEEDYLPAYNGGISQEYQVQIEDELFEQGSSQGITFVASSGDHGSDPKGPAGTPYIAVEEPASDPYVTGVGGTNLETTYTDGSDNSAYVSEFERFDTEAVGVWASGGGKSIFWAKPSYQSLVPTGQTVRTVPDVALHMGGCPSDATDSCEGIRSADVLIIGGAESGEIGTSASSPDIVGMFALTAKLANGRLGPMNKYLYEAGAFQIAHPTAVLFRHKYISGTNYNYTIAAPYDMVIGLGTPYATNFIDWLLGGSLPVSGVPGTATNP